MSIQAVSSTSSNQYLSALTSDFQNLQNEISSLESAQSSGNQDQVTLSKQALQKLMSQFQTDLSNATMGSQGTQGHHHHHHHHHVAGNSATNASGSTGDGTTAATTASSNPLTNDAATGQPQGNIFNIDISA